MIEFQHIDKKYRIAKRQAGMGNALKAFFTGNMRPSTP